MKTKTFKIGELVILKKTKEKVRILTYLKGGSRIVTKENNLPIIVKDLQIKKLPVKKTIF